MSFRFTNQGPYRQPGQTQVVVGTDGRPLPARKPAKQHSIAEILAIDPEKIRAETIARYNAKIRADNAARHRAGFKII